MKKSYKNSFKVEVVNFYKQNTITETVEKYNVSSVGLQLKEKIWKRITKLAK